MYVCMYTFIFSGSQNYSCAPIQNIFTLPYTTFFNHVVMEIINHEYYGDRTESIDGMGKVCKLMLDLFM